jgi:hypothetical protein
MGQGIEILDSQGEGILNFESLVSLLDTEKKSKFQILPSVCIFLILLYVFH